MNEVAEYLKECGTFFISTTDGDQPHVRPFGAFCIYEDKLYIVTNNKKNVYKQLLENPKLEICGMSKNTWIRIEGNAVHDARREARVAMMDANKNILGKMYSVDDNLMEVLYIADPSATIYSFTEEPKELNM